MTSEQTNVVVLRDPAGDYYVLPLETVQRGRVPAEHRAEAERLLAAAEGDDTSGYMANNRLTSGQAITLGTFLIVYGDVGIGLEVLNKGFEANRKGTDVGIY